MADKITRGGICHSIHRHAKANNKYIKNYDKKKESSYLIYLDYTCYYSNYIISTVTLHYHVHYFHRHLHISRAIAPQNSALHEASSQTRANNPGFLNPSH